MDHNIGQVKEIESALIGAVLRDGDTFPLAREIVSPEHFVIDPFSWAWQAMEHIHDLRLKIDVFTVADELERMGKMGDFSSGARSGRALLSDLRGMGEPKNVISYAALVEDYAGKRKLEPFLLKFEDYRRNGRPYKSIVQDMQTELSALQIYGQQDEYTVPFSVAVSEGYDQTDAASKGLNVGVMTGIIDLDEILGSLLPQNLYIVAGRPGQGKTALKLTIALNAARQGKRVALFVLEMSRAQVAQRLISQDSGIPLERIVRGSMDEKEWERFTESVGRVAKLPIVINDLSSIKIDEIRQTSRNIAGDGGLDLVVVDYIQLADAGKKAERRDLDVGEISRGLKYLARELNVPVLAGSQLSREIEKRTGKKPILSDLRESGSLEQDAYAVMFIYFADELNKALAEIIVAKHRNGRVGKADVRWMAEITRFDNATTKRFAPNELGGSPAERE